ncbi:hypothetical protein YPPY72_4088, partial [Yersinia pestis PY-72]
MALTGKPLSFIKSVVD